MNINETGNPFLTFFAKDRKHNQQEFQNSLDASQQTLLKTLQQSQKTLGQTLKSTQQNLNETQQAEYQKRLEAAEKAKAANNKFLMVLTEEQRVQRRELSRLESQLKTVSKEDLSETERQTLINQFKAAQKSFVNSLSADQKAIQRANIAAHQNANTAQQNFENSLNEADRDKFKNLRFEAKAANALLTRTLSAEQSKERADVTIIDAVVQVMTDKEGDEDLSVELQNNAIRTGLSSFMDNLSVADQVPYQERLNTINQASPEEQRKELNKLIVDVARQVVPGIE